MALRRRRSRLSAVSVSMQILAAEFQAVSGCGATARNNFEHAGSIMRSWRVGPGNPRALTACQAALGRGPVAGP